jgi:serine/threonine-protein phosphatase 5
VGSFNLDANKAIENDPDYIKAYYRRASANLVLGHYDDAVKDLEFVKSKIPNDASLDDKLKKAKIERKKKRFVESIASERVIDSKQSAIDKVLKNASIETTYSGQVFPENGNIDGEWVIKLMEDMKANKYLHKKYLAQVMSRLKDYWSTKPALIDINFEDDEEFNVCGDIHGQYYDLMNIFKVNGYPSKSNPYLFNGDFVDRGSFSVEVIVALMCWKVAFPEHFHLARGNHESRNLNKLYGFEGEVRKKYDESIYEAFCELFCFLPLAHCLNKKVLVVHGGIFSQDGVKLEDIRRIDRFREPPEKGLMCEILWSDPCKMSGRHPSKRGVGLSFGPDIAKTFLDSNGLGKTGLD